MVKLIRGAEKIISNYPPSYNFIVKTITKVPLLRAYFIESSDKFAHKFPISVKGVILRDNCVVLVKNERDEWELPGEKLEANETLKACVVREIYEELKLETHASTLLDVWMYTPKNTANLIVTFSCVEKVAREVTLSAEHQQATWFPLLEVNTLNMPEGYKHSIHRWPQTTS
ncbi:MAG: NUDIX hydrolase [Trueperaceae bacterium]